MTLFQLIHVEQIRQKPAYVEEKTLHALDRAMLLMRVILHTYIRALQWNKFPTIKTRRFPTLSNASNQQDRDYRLLRVSGNQFVKPRTS